MSRKVCKKVYPKQVCECGNPIDLHQQASPLPNLGIGSTYMLPQNADTQMVDLHAALNQDTHTSEKHTTRVIIVC